MTNGFKNVMENFPIYDTVLIGLTSEQAAKYPGGYQNFTEMADAEEIPFLNVRNSSEVGGSYTNITSKDKLPWLYYLDSFGFRFLYPDPNVDAASEHTGIMAASKYFQTVVCEHGYFEFSIREDVRLRSKPMLLPAGFGASGFISGNQTQNSWFSTLITNGLAQIKNRWRNTQSAMEIPRDTPVKGSLRFSEYGKSLLRKMGNVAGLDFGDETPFQNIAMIELTLIGVRGVQQRGEYHQD